MTIPALPDHLKELVMFDWFTALWQRMLSACTNGVRVSVAT